MRYRLNINSYGPLFTGAICMLVLSGCSSNLLEGGASGGNRNEGGVASKPTSVIEFDQKLEAIHDQASAEEAVNYFANHVAKNSIVSNREGYEEMANMSIASLSSSGTVFAANIAKKFAQIEARARKADDGFSIQGGDADLVSPEKLADTINSYRPENADPNTEFQASEITSSLEFIREQIPNLASSESPNMTPFEASVLTYFMLTGDEGAGVQPGYELRTTPEELNDFTGKLIGE